MFPFKLRSTDHTGFAAPPRPESGGIHVSETSQGPGWWLASDGRWYPPQTASDAGPAAPAVAEPGAEAAVTPSPELTPNAPVALPGARARVRRPSARVLGIGGAAVVVAVGVLVYVLGFSGSTPTLLTGTPSGKVVFCVSDGRAAAFTWTVTNGKVKGSIRITKSSSYPFTGTLTGNEIDLTTVDGAAPKTTRAHFKITGTRVTAVRSGHPTLGCTLETRTTALAQLPASPRSRVGAGLRSGATATAVGAT